MSIFEVNDLILLKENMKPVQLDNLRRFHLSKFDLERFLHIGQWDLGRVYAIYTTYL